MCRFCGNLLFEDEGKDKYGNINHNVGSKGTTNLKAFSQGEDKEPSMTRKEKIGMITLDTKYSRGSVEVARSGRSTLIKHQSAKELRRQSLLKEAKGRHAAEGSKQRKRDIVKGGLKKTRGKPKEKYDKLKRSMRL